MVSLSSVLLPSAGNSGFTSQILTFHFSDFLILTVTITTIYYLVALVYPEKRREKTRRETGWTGVTPPAADGRMWRQSEALIYGRRITAPHSHTAGLNPENGKIQKRQTLPFAPGLHWETGGMWRIVRRLRPDRLFCHPDQSQNKRAD